MTKAKKKYLWKYRTLGVDMWERNGPWSNTVVVAETKQQAEALFGLSPNDPFIEFKNREYTGVKPVGKKYRLPSW